MSQDRSSHIKNGIQSFLDHVSSLESAGEHGFDKEYEMIQEAQIRYHRENVTLMEVGKLENNLKKNRYKDILPYDSHRLVLSVVNNDDDPTTDYINASLIAGVEGKGDYIASQGPLASTVNDFWRMIWEYNVAIVFMACRTVEMGKMKCKQYWNDVGNSQVFGDITVFTETEDEIMSDCLRRRFKVTKGDEVRHVIQFHYSGWPDHGIPDDPGHIRDMLGMMRQARSDSKLPLLVHCSAGCGRTGAVIAIDYVWTMLEEGKFDETFSLFDLVCKMREQRMSLVQTPDQYALVNKVLKSLCEEWMAKLTHTYENVNFNQDVPDFEDGKPAEETAEEHIYEDVWNTGKEPEMTSKESPLIPPERSFNEQRHLQKSDKKKPGPRLSEETSDGVDPIYENFTVQKQTTKTQRHPQLLDGKGHVTVIQTGPSSPIRKDMIQSPSSPTTKRNEIPRPSSPMWKNDIPSSPNRRNEIPSSPTRRNEIPSSPTRRNEIQPPSSPVRWNEIPGTGEKIQTGHGYLSRTVSAGPVQESTKPHNVSGTIVFQKLTQESRADNSVPPKTETPATVGRSEGAGGWRRMHELFTQSFPFKNENPPSLANREAFSKTAFRAHKSQGYTNQGIPATYRRGDPRVSPHHQTKMMAVPWSQPAQASPHRQASRSHSSGAAASSKARNFSSSSEGNPSVEYRSPAVVLERSPTATVPMAYVNPRYKGFVLLNNGKNSVARQNQHQQSSRRQRKPSETVKYALPDL